MKIPFFTVFIIASLASGIPLNVYPVCSSEDALTDTTLADGIEHHQIGLVSYLNMINGEQRAGQPSLPYVMKTFMLPPGTEISDISVSTEEWTVIPGRYRLYPAETEFGAGIGRMSIPGLISLYESKAVAGGVENSSSLTEGYGIDAASYIPGSASITVEQSADALLLLESVDVDDDKPGPSEGSDDGVMNPGETIELHISAENSGSSTATHVTAEIKVISGSEYLDSILVDQISLPNISCGEIGNGNLPFIFTISENVESYSTIHFEIEFLYNFNQSWQSPYYCTVFSESYVIPVIDIESSQAPRQAIINMSNLFLVNTGAGTGLDIELTVTGVNPPEPFSCNTISTLGTLEPDGFIEIAEDLYLTVSPRDPSTSPWTSDSDFTDCSYQIQVSGIGGKFQARKVDLEQAANPGTFPVLSNLREIETGEDYIDVSWNKTSGTAELEGFYLYYTPHDGSSASLRLNSLPLSASAAQLTDLEPGTEYDIYVTAVDEAGRESAPEHEVFSTKCEIAEGWPVQLDGSTGTGPVIINMDSDPENEIVAVSSFGNVYIIESDGQKTVIQPSPSLEYDRFVSLAVGDTDNDSENEIVVSCQQNLYQGYAAVLLYDEISAGNWSMSIIGTMGPDETVCGAEAAGTPVLFQANDSATLEVALRTRGNSTSLHMWQWNSGWQDWTEPAGFPIALTGDFFAEPIAVDFDDDGYGELLVTQVVNDYSVIHVVDFHPEGYTEYDIQLTELGTSGRVYSTLAAVEWNGEVYVSGVAGYENTGKRIFVYNITSSDIGMVWYNASPLDDEDFLCNMGGPAIGHADADGVPDIFYALNGMSAWELLSEQSIFDSGEMSINPQTEAPLNAKSATIAAGSTSPSSIVTVPFVGFSSKFYGHDPLHGMNVLPGFPAWTETASWTAPVIGDVDNDNRMEVLTATASGLLTLYKWDGYETTSGWPVFQHDAHRTGFFNSEIVLSGFDIELKESELVHVSGGGYSTLLLTVEVTGTSSLQIDQQDEAGHQTEISTDRNSFRSQCSGSIYAGRSFSGNSIKIPEESCSNPAGSSEQLIKISAYCGTHEMACGYLPLADGVHQLSLLLERDYPGGRVTAYADPEHCYSELNESNNACTVQDVSAGSSSGLSVSIQSPSNCISVSLSLQEDVPEGLELSVYSLNGRLCSRVQTNELAAGNHQISLSSAENGSGTPAGVYLVHIRRINCDAVIRTIVVL